jgi:hypothetical protein
MENQETKGDISRNIKTPNVESTSSGKIDEISTLNSYEVFEKCIKRAENLISFHSTTEKIEEISEQHYSDCYRAAVVLTISALDAFVRKLVISEIVKMIANKRPLNSKLSDYLKQLLNQDKLLEAARNYDLIERVEEVIKSDFETKSFQGEWKITSYMEMVGYKDIFSEVSVKVDINEKNLKRKLSIFISRRHIIAHSGDIDLNQNPHKENIIDKKYANQCVETVRLFAKTINDIIEKK